MKLILFFCFHLTVIAFADVIAYSGAQNEAPLTWKAASCGWKGKDLVVSLGEQDEKPRVRISLSTFDDYTAYLKKNQKMTLKIVHSGLGDVLYKDVDGFEREIPNHVKEATCVLQISEVRYDGNFLEAFTLTMKCEGFRRKGVPFQRSLEIRDKDPIHCTF